MRKVLYPLTILTLLAVIHFSCQKEVNGTLPVEDLSKTVNASIAGRIVDEKKQPVAGALVKTENGFATTDINGSFALNNIQIKQSAGFIKIEKAGYFTGSKTIVVNESAENYIEVELIPQTIAGTFNTTSGGAVIVPNGGNISFPASAVINSTTNSAYTGTVSVAASFLNPSAANFAAIMPGALRGVTTADEQVALESYGMMAVDLKGANGEKLQLATGKTATISFPIAQALLAKAPQTIPLWYFDETTGLWIEQGTATKQGNNYVGTVSHFSFWNCDAPFPLIDFEAVLQDQNGQPVKARMVVSFGSGKSSISSSGFSDDDGKIGGKVPANELLYIDIYNQCNEIVYTKQFGPYTTKTNLGTIKTPFNQLTSVITGTAANCSSASVATGIVNVLFNGKNYRSQITNGTFSVTVTSCASGSSPAKITAYDISTSKISDTVLVNITAGSNVATGKITACQANTSSTISFTIGTANYNYATPIDSVTCFRDNATSRTNIFITSSDGSDQLTLTFLGAAAPGNYPIENIKFKDGNTIYYKTGTPSLTITEYGTAGQFIGGNFTGNFERMDTTIHPMNFTFRLQRN